MTVRHAERGWAMLSACALLVAAGTLAAVLLERDQTMRNEAAHDAVALRAFHAVEGGLAHVRHALARNPDYPGATLAVGTVDLAITVRRTAPDAWAAEIRAPGQGRGLRAELRARPGLPRVVARTPLR